MKRVLIVLQDQEYQKLTDAKDAQGKTWRELLIRGVLGVDAQRIHIGPISEHRRKIEADMKGILRHGKAEKTTESKEKQFDSLFAPWAKEKLRKQRENR